MFLVLMYLIQILISVAYEYVSCASFLNPKKNCTVKSYKPKHQCVPQTPPFIVALVL